jgi:hypothetical protein
VSRLRSSGADWTRVEDDDLLARLGTALAPGPATEASPTDAVVVPLERAIADRAGRAWRRPAAWAAAVLLVAGVAAGLAAAGDGTDRLGTVDPAVPGTVASDPEVVAVEAALDVLESKLSIGDPADVAAAAEELRVLLDALDADQRALFGDRPAALLERADTFLATTTTSLGSAPTATIPSSPTSVEDHGGDDNPGGDDNSGGDNPGGDDNSREGSPADDNSGPGSDSSGSADSGSSGRGSDD